MSFVERSSLSEGPLSEVPRHSVSKTKGGKVLKHIIARGSARAFEINNSGINYLAIGSCNWIQGDLQNTLLYKTADT